MILINYERFDSNRISMFVLSFAIGYAMLQVGKVKC